MTKKHGLRIWAVMGWLLLSASCASSAEKAVSPEQSLKPQPFEIKDQNGVSHSLSGLTAEGPLVLVFLRGFA